jgi:hypothetical protein
MSLFEASPSVPIQSDSTKIEVIYISQTRDSPFSFIDSDDKNSDPPPIDILFERYIH